MSSNIEVPPEVENADDKEANTTHQGARWSAHLACAFLSSEHDVMPRTYDELLSDDPAWPELAKAAASAPNGAVTLAPVSDEQRRACLEALQMTTRSTLGALGHETGGVLVDHGFVRHLGSGCPRLPRRLCDWNAELGIDLARFVIVADDLVGGVFAVDGKELGDQPGRVHYFAPDALEWEDTELFHSAFVAWTFEGDLDDFYGAMRWPGWEQDASAIMGDQTFSMVPPLWTKPDLPMGKRVRRAVPAKDVWQLQEKFAKSAK